MPFFPGLPLHTGDDSPKSPRTPGQQRDALTADAAVQSETDEVRPREHEEEHTRDPPLTP